MYFFSFWKYDKIILSKNSFFYENLAQVTYEVLETQEVMRRYHSLHSHVSSEIDRILWEKRNAASEIG